MYLKKEELIGLPVFTQRGDNLGRVSDLEIDAESHLVFKYHVKSSGLIKGLFEDKLLVDRQQVISLDKEKMTVEDAVLSEGEKIKAAAAPTQQ